MVRPAAAQSFTFPLIETFKNSTAPGWVLGGTALLTSGSADPAGDGWLRLTRNTTYQAGYAYYNTPIPTGRGLVITFDYVAWGGTNADGLSFFLFDGTTTTFNVGASGGSLGYAQKTGVKGLSGGYLGLGLDEFGNYSNPTEGRVGGPGFIKHAVAVRGPGSGTTGYTYLAGTTNLTQSPWNLPRLDCPANFTGFTNIGVSNGSCGNGATRPAETTYYRQVQITVTPVGAAYQITVAMKFGPNDAQWHTLFGPFTMPTSAPGTLKMGFAASTGGSTNYHEIRNLTVTQQVPDLTATKAVQNATTGGGSVAPGEELLYTVVLKNNTGTAITGVSFSDPIPTNTTYLANSATASSGVISYNDGTKTLSVTGMTVPGNGQATITFRVQVNNPLPAGVTTISNQGAYTYGSTTAQTDGDMVTPGEQATMIDVTAGPNFDTATKTVLVFNDVAPLGEVSPGDTLLYRVTLPNSGNQDSPTTMFSDVLPGNTTYVAGSATVSAGTVSYNSTTKTLTWAVSVNAGSQATLEFKVTVNSGVKIRDVISNQGTVTSGSTTVLTDADLMTPGKQPTVLLVGGQATLTALKTAAILTPPLQPGGQLEYTVVLTNTGSYAVSGATFVDTLPANTTYVAGSATTTSGSIAYDSGTRTLNVTGISATANGGTVTIRFRVQVDNPLPSGVTQISNQGVVNWDANNSGSNNTSLATDADPTTPGQQPTISTISHADLAVTKTLNNANPAENEVIAYTVRITNTGPSAVTNAVVADPLPMGLTPVSVNASQGSYTSPTWNVGALADGASATLTINARVNLGQGGGTIVNTATGSAELYDANSANNTASVSLTVKRTVLTGVVTDKDSGVVLEGVNLKVTDSQNNICNVTTDSNGYYTVTSGVDGCLLMPGPATVEVTGAPDGYLLTSATPTINAGMTTIQNLALVRPGLSGVVTDAGTGVPIAGAVVTLTQGTSTCVITTEADGRYSFVAGTGSPVCTFTDGPATVAATRNGYQGTSATPTILSTGPTTQDLALPTANLLITKTDGKTDVRAGETLEYVITVVNQGSLTANTVIITDVLPQYLSYGGWATSSSGVSLFSATPPFTYSWFLGDLAVGASKSLTLTASVAISLPDGTTMLSNYACVTTGSPEADITNNERADTDSVTAHPDLTLFKSATANSVPIRAGSTITYTYNGDNRGNAIATGVRITDTLDTHTTYVDGSAVLVAGGNTYPVTVTYDNNLKRLVLELPNMPPGISGYLRYQATVTTTLPSGTTLITNTAVVTSNESDWNPDNNSSTLVLSVLEGADTYIRKTGVPLPNPAVPGGNIVYLLDYGNLGNNTAVNVVLTDVIPANTTYIGGSLYLNGVNLTDAQDTDAGQYMTTTHTISLTLGTLAVGASGQVSFTVRIDDVLPAGVTGIANTAAITSSVADPVPDSNQFTAPVPVNAYPDLVIRKGHSGVYFEANQTITYTLTYSNTGNQVATGVIITDTLDDLLTYVGSSPAGSYSNHKVTWNIGELAVDGAHTIVLTATVSAAASGELSLNRGEIGDDGLNGPDPDPASNRANDIVRVARPILILEKSLTGENYVTGQMTYTLTYRNNGPIAARHVVISDVLPANTTLVAGSITGGGSYDNDTSTVTWNLGDLAVGVCGSVSFAVTLNPGVGGATQAAPTLSSESASAMMTLTSTTGAVGSPWCSSAGCATIRGYWNGSNPVGPAGWEANPQLAGAVFNDADWTLPVEPGTIEPYWLAGASLDAQWVAVTNTTQYAQNYSFFRQYFYLPPNARGFSGSLQIAGDDIADIYINGRYIGTHYGGGSATVHDVGSAILAGVNLLAIRLTGNTHNGHAIYNGGDHPGLLYRLNVGYARLIPFAAAPTVTLKGQEITLTIQEWLRGKSPFSYTVAFGDTQMAPYSTTTSFKHTYTTPGTYTLTVTARDQLGSLATDILTITVLPAEANLLVNRATTGYENKYGVHYSGESGAGVMLVEAADLSVVKTVVSGGTVPGQNVTYKLVVTNNGPDAVTGATVTDNLPTSVTNVTWICTSSGGTCAHESGSGNPLNETVNLPKDATAIYTLTGTVDPAATGTLTNTATISPPAGLTDPFQDNNSSTVNTTLTPVVNLAISKTSSPNPGLAAGRAVRYVIVVTNNGPSDATGVTVQDTFPTTLTNVTWTCTAASGSTCSTGSSGDITDTATIKAGGRITYTVNATVITGTTGTLTNTATAIYNSMPVSATDSNTLVAMTTLTATKDALTAAGLASRTIPFVDADGNGGISPGDTLKYRVIITNTDATTAYHVLYNDMPDSHTTLVAGSVTATGGTGCNVIQGNTAGDIAVSINCAALAPDSSVTVEYQTTVNSPLPFQLASLLNQGAVTASNAEALATDDPATANVSGDPTIVTLTMGSIRGIVWRDNDADGIYDTGELTLSDVAVTLYYAGEDGAWETDDDQTAYSFTTAEGTYNFGNLAAGKYRIGFGIFHGFVFSPLGQDSDVNPDTGLTDELTLTANQAITNVNAGFCSQMDFGNLPSGFANTKFINDGARHVITTTFYLGQSVAADYDGDEGVSPSDNDGVRLIGVSGPHNGVFTVTLTVTVTGSGQLWGWFDWNQNMKFDPGGVGTKLMANASAHSLQQESTATEMLAMGEITGTQTLVFTTTTNLKNGNTLYARFRLYPTGYAQEATPYGSIEGGEVEDYEWEWKPTAVTLVSFSAAPQAGGILLTWETAAELDNAGFNLYRSATPEGPYTLLNATLIPPQFPGAISGGVYTWLDTEVQPGVTYSYKLEDIDIRGVSTFHGPVTATARAATSAPTFTVFLPLVFRQE